MTMKWRFWKTLSLVVLMVMSLHSLGWAANLPKYTLAQENEYLRLYVQEDTAEIAVEDIATGSLWFSSPQDLRMEQIKRGNARDGMRSLISLNYFTPRREGRSLNSYVDSVLNEEFSVSISQEEVRFDFVLGKQWADEAHYPIFIAKDKFEALLEKVEDSFDRKLLEEAYSLVVFEEQDGDPYERVPVYGLDLPTLFGNYKIDILSGSLLGKRLGTNNTPNERTKHYMERFADTIVSHRNDIERRGLITAKDVEFVRHGPFYALLDETYPAYYKPEFFRIFHEIGYTPQDVAEDHEGRGIDLPRPNPQIFTIPVICKLDGPNLVVTVPAGEIKYPINVENADGDLETFYPYSIDLLPYFGAAYTDASGYMFVPDRSGGLIYLNNSKKLGLPSYYGAVYGVDRSTSPQIERITDGAYIRLPVYGLKEEDKAFFTIIEEGQALANLSAELAGKTDSFNKIFSRFVLTPRATITLYGVESSQDDKLVDAYSVRPYQGNITLRIGFLTGDEANYPGMANYYRSYLVNRYGLERIDSDSPLPLNVELIGGIHDKQTVVGAPREVIHPMTTYTDVVTILNDLQNRGVDHVRVRYVGWSKGGVEHFYPNKVRLEMSLGAEEDFQALLDFVDSNSVDLYLDVNFMTVYRNTLFDGFKVGRDAARFLNRSAAKVWDFNIATFQQISDRYAYVLSPRVLDGLVSSFLKDLERYKTANISLREMGRRVYSDFIDDEVKMVDRQQALEITQEQMEKMVDDGWSIMVRGGNDSSFPYAAQIVEAPTEASPMLIVDEAVPFYQMVLHGYIDVSGTPYNFGGVSRDKLLKSLETGELPYYRWSYADSSIVKGTDFDYLLSTNYYGSVEEGVKLYLDAAPILQKVRGQTILNHEKLGSGVYRTTYENGVEIAVNYTDNPFWWNGRSIPAHGYTIFERSEGR